MSTVAAAAQTADRVDYWIRRHVIQYCYGTHPSQSQSKFNSARDRRVGLLAIGQCLKEQYDAPLDSYAPASRCTRRAARNAEIGRLHGLVRTCELKNRMAHHVYTRRHWLAFKPYQSFAAKVTPK
jgi:hypothetical protein